MCPAAVMRHRRGPCLEAARTQQPVRVSTRNVDARWPQFVNAARHAGVRSTLSVPLIVTSATSEGNDELVGSLNAYSRSAVTFDEFDEKLLSLYTGVAGPSHCRYAPLAAGDGNRGTAGAGSELPG
jgi:GAF domain-containing protein